MHATIFTVLLSVKDIQLKRHNRSLHRKYNVYSRSRDTHIISVCLMSQPLNIECRKKKYRKLRVNLETLFTQINKNTRMCNFIKHCNRSSLCIKAIWVAMSPKRVMATPNTCTSTLQILWSWWWLNDHGIRV